MVIHAKMCNHVCFFYPVKQTRPGNPLLIFASNVESHRVNGSLNNRNIWPQMTCLPVNCSFGEFPPSDRLNSFPEPPAPSFIGLYILDEPTKSESRRVHGTVLQLATMDLSEGKLHVGCQEYIYD